MEPQFVEIEDEFGRFVRTFRGGTIVRDLIPDAPQMPLNADYLFSDDNIVAELKCLHKDVSDREQLSRRFLSVCQRLGYPTEHALRIAFREIPLPRNVAQAVITKSLDHVRKALRKAHHQILATKQQLGRMNALGLVIISNERNIELTPFELIQFMLSQLTAMASDHIDGVIYMTPNLYHPVGQDGVLRSLWLPGYRRAGTRLTDFVDELGTAWFKFREGLDSSLVSLVKSHEPPLSDFHVCPTLTATKSM